MRKDIIRGQYLPLNSKIHIADVRLKIVLTLLMIINIFLIKTLILFAITILFLLIMIRYSHIPVRYILNGLKPIMYIIIFTCVINILTINDLPIINLKVISISYKAIEISIILALRLVLMIASASILTITTLPSDLTYGIEKLLKPFKLFKVPSHEIAMMMSIALRFIPTIFDEFDKIIKAQKSRGADFDNGSLLKKIKCFIPILVPLFINTFKRADELTIAMESRCYRGDKGRTRMKELKLSIIDFRIMIFMCVYFCLEFIIFYFY